MCDVLRESGVTLLLATLVCTTVVVLRIIVPGLPIILTIAFLAYQVRALQSRTPFVVRQPEPVRIYSSGHSGSVGRTSITPAPRRRPQSAARTPDVGTSALAPSIFSSSNSMPRPGLSPRTIQPSSR
jgi:hypothetical protein